MRTFACALMVVGFLGASTVFAGQQRSKEEVYAAAYQMIEKAKAETEYEWIQEFYSRGLLVLGGYFYRNPTACGDPELPAINEAMRALERELWDLYKAREEAGDKPKLPPAKYQTCEEVAIEKENKEKADAIAREKKAKADAIARADAKAHNEARAKIPEVYVSLRDGRNQEIGRMLDNGTVRNARNENIGAIKEDGTITDGRNYKIGAIKEDGTITDGSNYKIGAIKEDGAVTDGRNYRIGAIEPDGTVKNERNEKIGMAPKVKKEWAAAFFFFFFRE